MESNVRVCAWCFLALDSWGCRAQGGGTLRAISGAAYQEKKPGGIGIVRKLGGIRLPPPPAAIDM